MAGLRLCSRQSDKPYYIEDMDKYIYSIEELAYYLYHNVYFVDSSFFNYKLVEYIKTELNMPQLASKLQFSIGQKMGFSELIMFVILNSHYFDEDEIKVLQKHLDIIGTKSLKDRMKLRAEMLYKNGKLESAYEAFMNILNEKEHHAVMTGNRENDGFYAGIYLGIGKIKARMFYFSEAVEFFKKSYILDPDKLTAESLIYAILLERNYVTDTNEDFLQDIIKELGSLSVEEDLIIECTKNIKEKALKTELTQEYEHLEKTVTYDGRRNLNDFYEEIRIIIEEWKKEYRSQI